MLVSGLVLALAAAGWQYFSPASRELVSGRDVSLALLGERSSALLVYHPFSSTVNAFTLSHQKARPGISNWHRASDVIKAAGGGGTGENVFYIALSSAPELDLLWDTLNNWRAEPRRLKPAVAWLSGLRASGATNLSGFDLFSLTAEFSKLTSANFILTEVQRRAQAEEAAQEESQAPMVEVFNGSGRTGLAALAAKRLRAMGYDVITETSYPTLERHTSVISFSADTSAARRLRDSLGLKGLEIRVKSAQKSVAGAAVVLGQDYKAEEPEKQ